MSRNPKPAQPELVIASKSQSGQLASWPEYRLGVTFQADGALSLQWSSGEAVFMKGLLRPSTTHYALDWEQELENRAGTSRSSIGLNSQAISTFLRGLHKRTPVSNENIDFIVYQPADGKPPFRLAPPEGLDNHRLLVGLSETYALLVLIALDLGFTGETCQQVLAPAMLNLLSRPGQVPGRSIPQLCWGINLRIIVNQALGYIDLEYWLKDCALARGTIRCTGANQLTWVLQANGATETVHSNATIRSVAINLATWSLRYPCWPVCAEARLVGPQGRELVKGGRKSFSDENRPSLWLTGMILEMARDLSAEFEDEQEAFGSGTLTQSFLEAEERRFRRQEERLAAERAQRQRILAEKAEARRRREKEAEAWKQAAANDDKNQKTTAREAVVPKEPLPPLPIRVEQPPLELQPTMLAQQELARFFLQEQAALWWVSNQTDDLLCLPFCRIAHLEYQIRAALRVMGPLRGRALLSDEVGLGKTIEAGLVLKELLTRGMVERFLVLTLPSLVDQWQEELADKFGLQTRSTNEPEVRAEPSAFWNENRGIVASLHTLKQPAHLENACQSQWDILIVDEAQYLRNRESQAWQAVNALPRRFLLLLTATPVQNSLEELYNLITLLQPGQLPSPKEFRARFIDPKRPRQPREPEELRRLLGQVMIRTTRANSGMKLPPRRAETVLFEAEPDERQFWESWETEFRDAIGKLPTSQANLWGRLLLQSAGSSPAAFLEALNKFPDQAARARWQANAPLTGSWKRKCELIPPLTKTEGGTVIFTQYLKTQSALAEELRAAGVPVFLIHGGTPAAERQPVVEEFRKNGGALLLTHSGTEGRNLQFSHRLVNFDLPWNPMEIEQRIGRLHRLGQQQPVRIYNFVQKGTLQEHLLDLLQEKLNLFELVVGETGLILGERYSTDEFAEEIFRRWRESDGKVAEALADLGDELVAARSQYDEVKELDSTLFRQDFEST